jgi:putative flippase GtrA
MLKIFTRYTTVGVLNTAVHWSVFLVFFYLIGLGQAFSNFGAFCIAVTVSFFANAKYTFKEKTTSKKYLAYVSFMGALSAVIGTTSDKLNIPPLVTLVLFSIISLAVGFSYSKLIIFRNNAQ